MNDNQKKTDAEVLRLKAEGLLKTENPPGNASTLSISETDLAKLIHELQVHQVEQEMQNEELRHAWATGQIAVDKYTELYEFAPTGYLSLSKEGIIVEVNFATSQMLGKERVRLKNRSFGFYVSDDTKPVFKLFLEKVFTTRLKETCMLTLTTYDKSPLYVQLTGRLSERENHCMISMIDITERVRQEKTIKESESRFKSLFERHNAIMLLIDPESGKILSANQAASVFYGYSIPVLCDMSIDQINKFSAEKIKAEREKAAAEQRNYFIFPHLLASGEERIVEVHSSPIEFQGSRILFSIIHDITARWQAEAEIILKNAELSKLIAEKDKFFSIIAHDLRNPFNTFLGYTQMMVEDIESLTLAELQKIALSMRNSATNLFGLLENLLEWSRIRRGVTNFEPALSPLMSTIEESIATVVGLADKKEIEIGFEIADDCNVFADRYMLNSIVRNLVTNAIKFSHRGGKIAIAAKPITGNLVEISIRDSGIGMNEKMVENLFRLDEQTNRKGTEGESTTGLGLIICKEFVEKHGGTLWVKSEEGKGATVYFSLPAGEGKNDE
ncbi:MAG: PAS domain-containing sensor histidine kinase [Bacteroidota bacterium]